MSTMDLLAPTSPSLRAVASVLMALALVASSCGSGDGAPADTDSSTSAVHGSASTYRGVDGVEASIEDTSRLLMLNGDLTEIAFELGAGDRVVGIDLTTTYPPEATTLPDVGLSRDLDAEAVIGLSPTLVIGDTQVGPESSLEQIRSAGIPVIILQAEVTLEGVTRKIRNVGTILDLEADAEALATRVQGEIDDALELVEEATDEPRAAFLYVRGPETLLLFGNGMPTHFLIEAVGAVDAAGDIGVLFAQDLQAEQLVRAAPDVLITPTQGYDILGGLDAFLALPGVADTPAGRSGAVLTYDEALFLGMGPRVGQALRRLALDLHPELGG